MLSSAITLFLFAAVGPIAVAAAPQLPDVGAAPPATTPSALELGVRLTRIALDGALVAAQQMLALEQALAGGSVGSESGASSSVSTRVAGSAPNSSPVRTTVVLGHEKTFLRPQRQNEQQLPVDQQIRAAHDAITLFTTAASHARTLNMALAPTLASNATNSGASAALQRALAQQQQGQVARAALLANLTDSIGNDAPLLERFVDEVRGAVDAADAMLRLVDQGVEALN